MEQDRLFFLETPIHTDNLDGYAKLAAAVDTPIAMGEFLSNRFEFLEYMTRDGVDVVQPDIGRAGGLTECRRIANLARDRGLIVVPHGWKTAISVAGLIHFSASLDNCPLHRIPRSRTHHRSDAPERTGRSRAGTGGWPLRAARTARHRRGTEPSVRCAIPDPVMSQGRGGTGAACQGDRPAGDGERHARRFGEGLPGHCGPARPKASGGSRWDAAPPSREGKAPPRAGHAVAESPRRP